MEMGVGFGQFTKKMLAEGRNVLAIDHNDDYLRALMQSTATSKLTCLKLDFTAPGRAGQVCRNFRADTILCMNVLEHVPDDRAALRFLHSVGGRSCRIVIQVPALLCIYNALDRDAGHFRRYNQGDLVTLLRVTGWRASRVRYFNIPGVLGWIFAGLLGRWRKDGGSLNSVHTNLLVQTYDRLFVSLSRGMDPFFKNIAGLSLLAIARKDEGYVRDRRIF
jgi:hypothetical protein